MIVDLGNGVALNPDHVVSIRQDYHGGYLIIRDVLGNVHEVQRGHRESIWQAQERVTKLLSKPQIEGTN